MIFILLVLELCWQNITIFIGEFVERLYIIEHFRPAKDQFKYLEDNTKNTSQLKLGASEGEEDDANIWLFWKLATLTSRM